MAVSLLPQSIIGMDLLGILQNLLELKFKGSHWVEGRMEASHAAPPPLPAKRVNQNQYCILDIKDLKEAGMVVAIIVSFHPAVHEDQIDPGRWQ